MLLLRTFAPWVLLAFLGHQVSLSSGARNKTRGADRTAVAASSGRAQRSGNKGTAGSGRGKFSLKGDNMQCTWVASDSGDAVRLSVKCENPEARVKGGTTDMQCKYNARPQSCPGYRSDPKGFWKQVGRALRRLQGKVCIDVRALVRASMCKRAPRDAHFKLDVSSSVKSGSGGDPERPRAPRTTTTTTTTTTATARPTAGQGCTRRADHRQSAEEYCNSSWASVCSFFFSMMQSDDC